MISKKEIFNKEFKKAQYFSAGAIVALEISKEIIMEYLHNNIMQISISKHVWLKWVDYLKKSSPMDFFR